MAIEAQCLVKVKTLPILALPTSPSVHVAAARMRSRAGTVVGSTKPSGDMKLSEPGVHTASPADLGRERSVSRHDHEAEGSEHAGASIRARRAA